MRSYIFLCFLIGLQFYQCVQTNSGSNDFIKNYSSIDKVCDVGYDPAFLLWRSNDTCNGYIDINYGSVSIFQNKIVCSLIVSNLPDTLLFNNDSIEPMNTEYWWEFVFQNKTDTTKIVYITAGQYKRNNLPQWYGYILDNTFAGLAIYTRGKDNAIYYNHPLVFTKKGNILIMTYYDDENLGIVEHILNSSIIVNTRRWVNTSPDIIEDKMKILD